MLAVAAIEPQPVPLKTLFPLLEAAALENEDLLKKTWAALLANAANPNLKTSFAPSYVEILRQLGTNEVRVIDFIYKRLVNDDIISIEFNEVNEVLLIPQPLLKLAFDNLIRLRVCSQNEKFTIDDEGHLIQHLGDMSRLNTTNLGIAFIIACTPPIVESNPS